MGPATLFRNKQSTNHALLSLTEDIRNALDNNYFAIGVFIDLQKAFDSVDHEILLHKLNYYGIRDMVQDKAIQVINFAQYNESRSPLYKNSKVLKFNDNVALLNFMYVFDSIKGNLPTILNYNFNPILNLYSCNTRCAEQHQMTLPQVKTQIYGLKSIEYQSTHIWNTVVNKFPEKELHK